MRFLFVCLEERTSLATTATNVYIALYQVCAISAGLLADKLIGMLLFIQLDFTILFTRPMLISSCSDHFNCCDFEIQTLGQFSCFIFVVKL